MAIFFAFFGNFFWRTKWTYNCELFSTYLLIFRAKRKKNFLRWARLLAFCLSKTKKSNGIIICDIKTSLWTRIIEKCCKLKFLHVIEYLFVNSGVISRLLQHGKFLKNSIDRFWGIVVTSLKNTVLRKTHLNVQIRKKRPHLKRKKSFFMMTIHYLTRRKKISKIYRKFGTYLDNMTF